MSRVALGVVAVLAIACGASAPDGPVAYVDASYREGQEYAFAGRPSDDDPRLIVLRTDDLGAGHHAIHIAVSGVTIRSPGAPGGVVHEIGHLPMTPEALDASGLRLLREDAPRPAYEDGYRQWREAHGGVFTQPLAETIDTVEQGLGD